MTIFELIEVYISTRIELVTKLTREALLDWISFKELNIYDWLFLSRKNRGTP